MREIESSVKLSLTHQDEEAVIAQRDWDLSDTRDQYSGADWRRRRH